MQSTSYLESPATSELSPISTQSWLFSATHSLSMSNCCSFTSTDVGIKQRNHMETHFEVCCISIYPEMRCILIRNQDQKYTTGKIALRYLKNMLTQNLVS